jgi:hypothetical protein
LELSIVIDVVAFMRSQGVFFHDDNPTQDSAIACSKLANCLKIRVHHGYFDHYLRQKLHFDGLLSRDHVFRPKKLADALFHIIVRQQRLKRWSSLPPFPHLTGIVYEPRQLQRFPRSCLLLVACRLATTRGNYDWRSYIIHSIVERVCSDIVKKVKVRRLHCGICACDFRRADFFLLTHCPANVV